MTDLERSSDHRHLWVFTDFKLEDFFSWILSNLGNLGDFGDMVNSNVRSPLFFRNRLLAFIVICLKSSRAGAYGLGE